MKFFQIYTTVLLCLTFGIEIFSLENYFGCVRFLIKCSAKNHSEFVFKDQVEFLKIGPFLTDLIACKNGISHVEKVIKEKKFNHQVNIHFERQFKQEMRETKRHNAEFKRYIRSTEKNSRSSKRKALHEFYMNYDMMKNVLKRLAAIENYTDYQEIGTTHENRTIFVIKISKNDSLPVIWIDGGIHAREWISPASVLYFIDYVISKNGEHLLDKYKFIVLPIINPDGYEYSQTVVRMWRKNRNLNRGSSCVGVDLNRNFPTYWAGNEEASSSNPCASTYRGCEAASELETKAMVEYLMKLNREEKFQLYLSFHSYGQYILTAYGYEAQRYPDNYYDLVNPNSYALFKLETAQLVANTLEQKHEVIYTVGNAVDLLYVASGGSDDFVTKEVKPAYSYTIELSPDSENSLGFSLPPSQIRKVGRHVVQIVTSLIEHMESL